MYEWPRNTAPSPGYWWTWPDYPNTQPKWNEYQTLWSTCPHCSKLVQWGSVFCSSCGHKLIQEETDIDKLEKIQQTLEELLKEVRGLQGTVIE